jgi:hypothetical protein
MKKRVRVPLFFFVDTAEITEEQKREIVDWFNLVGENAVGGARSQPFGYDDGAFIGFFDKNHIAHKYLGAHYYYDRYDVPEGTEEVTYDFWKEHIKEKQYTVVTNDEEVSTNVKEVYRYQVCVAFLYNSTVGNALKDKNIPIPKVNGRILYDSKHVQYARQMGYYLNIYENDWVEVEGYNIPKSMIASGIAKKWLFKCGITGYYATVNQKIVLIMEGGEKVNASRERIGFIQSNRDSIFFENADAAVNYGYALCEVENDWIPASEARQQPNAAYHRMVKNHGFQWKCDEQITDFTIGFEIEKEDEEMRLKYPYMPLFNETGWIKESDSSLCDEAGYELVSPVFNLMDNTLEKEIEKNQSLKDLINGTYNIREYTEEMEDEGDYHDYGLSVGDTIPACGGHINIGSKTYSPIQLFFGIKGFLPLLYSIYDVRVDKTYSEAKPIKHYLDNQHCSDHHSALQIKDKVVEIRIVAAVRNVRNLLWRRDLVRIMVRNINKSEQEILRTMLNPRSILHKHLRKVYKSDERFFKKCNDFVRFSEQYNDVKLSEIDWDRFKH